MDRYFFPVCSHITLRMQGGWCVKSDKTKKKCLFLGSTIDTLAMDEQSEYRGSFFRLSHPVTREHWTEFNRRNGRSV
jgi:recombinational DNA repair protein RecR